MWTSRRSWKERKQATKVRENSSKLLSGVQEPELIYYGHDSGVVGFSKMEVYKNVSSSEVSHCGYDKNAHTMGQLNTSRNLRNGAGKLSGAVC